MHPVEQNNGVKLAVKSCSPILPITEKPPSIIIIKLLSLTRQCITIYKCGQSNLMKLGSKLRRTEKPERKADPEIEPSIQMML